MNIRDFINIVESMKPVKYFLRDTKDPQRDLERGFSCHIDGWCETEEEAWPKRDQAIADPKQDPHTGLWCFDPELGLSSWEFHDEKSYQRALHDLAQYGGEKIALFSSSDYDLHMGADGEDVFRNGTFLKWINFDTKYADL